MYISSQGWICTWYGDISYTHMLDLPLFFINRLDKCWYEIVSLQKGIRVVFIDIMGKCVGYGAYDRIARHLRVWWLYGA